MRRLFAVSWTMPPLLLPRSMQVSLSLKHLAELGWQSTVVCVDAGFARKTANYDPSLAALFAGCFRAVRVSSPEQWLPLQALWYLFPALRPVPDPSRLWVGRAVRAAQNLVANDKFSALISFSNPWSDHLVGLQLHRDSGLPWLAHFSDPWVDSAYFKGGDWQREMSRKMEEEVIREADAVVFITPQTAELVMRKYPAAWRGKVHVIPHGYDTGVLPLLEGPAQTRPCLRVVYTGSFYRGRRTPEALLQALQLLSQTSPLPGRIEIVLVGRQVKAYRRIAEELGVAGVVKFLDALPYLESLRMAAQADVLLVIDAPSDTESVFLPSKLVDYMMLKKPILGLTPLSGASADLLRRLECPVVAPDDVPAIAGTVSELIRLWQAGELGVSPAYESVAREYDIRQTTRTLHEVLEQLVST
jgi:glycosyltransferase involved in cell wall biosynthesis